MTELTYEEVTAKLAERPSTHEAGCVFGGFSCGYWIVVEGCDQEHWEEHYVCADSRCPCGTEFPGAVSIMVAFDATSPDDLDAGVDR